MAVRKLSASSAAAEQVTPGTRPQHFAAGGPVVLEAREASALYLLAKLKHMPKDAETEVRARLRENAKALRAALSHPFAREVARVLDRPSIEVSDDARRYAEYLIESAEPGAGHA